MSTPSDLRPRFVTVTPYFDPVDDPSSEIWPGSVLPVAEPPPDVEPDLVSVWVLDPGTGQLIRLYEHEFKECPQPDTPIKP